MKPGDLIITTQSILFQPDPCDWAQASIPKGMILSVLEVYNDRVAVEHEGNRVGLRFHLFKMYEE